MASSGLTYGTVTQAAPLLVRLDTATPGSAGVPASRLAAYVVTALDRVAVQGLGSGLLVLGKVV